MDHLFDIFLMFSTKFNQFFPVIWLRTFFCNFIHLFDTTFLTSMYDLPSFFAIVLHSTSYHDAIACAISISRLIVYVNRPQAKWTMISIASILQSPHVLITNHTNKRCIFFFFTHFLPFLNLFKYIFKKVGFRLGLTVNSHRACLN